MSNKRRTRKQIKAEIVVLERLASQYHHDTLARASIVGQINVLCWVLREL
jgi:hypothetical protein